MTSMINPDEQPRGEREALSKHPSSPSAPYIYIYTRTIIVSCLDASVASIFGIYMNI